MTWSKRNFYEIMHFNWNDYISVNFKSCISLQKIPNLKKTITKKYSKSQTWARKLFKFEKKWNIFHTCAFLFIKKWPILCLKNFNTVRSVKSKKSLSISILLFKCVVCWIILSDSIQFIDLYHLTTRRRRSWSVIEESFTFISWNIKKWGGKRKNQERFLKFRS